MDLTIYLIIRSTWEKDNNHILAGKIAKVECKSSFIGNKSKLS